MSKLEGIVEGIYQTFRDKEYAWKKDGKLYFPSRMNIRETILKLAKELLSANEPDHSLIETGRIMIKTDGEYIDVWLWQGSIKVDEL